MTRKASPAREKEWTLGFNAWTNEGSKALNPYDEGTFSHKKWQEGYEFAMSYDSTPSGITRKYAKAEDYDKILDDALDDDYGIWPSGVII